jgi:short-subunit dehydrogenase
MSYALITGGSKGIGKALATELAKQNYNLLLVARDKGGLHDAANEITAKHAVAVHTLALDLSAPNAAQQVYNWCVENNYDVTALINNAGYGLCGYMEEYTVAENNNMMQLNMFTTVNMCQLFLPMLKKQSKAYILNISGGIAYQAVGGMALYGASKAFVLYFSRALKHELRNTSVSVTCLAPGATDTEFVSRANIKPKALKAAKKVNMSAESVASIAIKGMQSGKAEIIPGLINKLSYFFTLLLPKSIVEKTAAGIYE